MSSKSLSTVNPNPLTALDSAVVPLRDFDSLLADAQPRLRGYVAALLGSWAEVDDLVQETNMVLLTKRETFEAGTNFIAWAFRVAFFKATTWRRDRMREGRVVLSETAFQELAAHAETAFEIRAPIEEALGACLRKIAPQERSLLDAKYLERRSLVDLAAALGCSANSLHQKISRIRLALRKCIDQHLRPPNP